ncbi:hypothetical protein BVC80_8417g5 [Macleaya cordata]|uniref:Uncharacterized protein n=1 Tax=Macleaya cordata TaxID=56857 RepID=A0A200Q553_MACCD|nr:hypothetical protein BVC80_8417g5 [Macleaya cordata]
MDFSASMEGEEEIGKRTRSFRDEDYNNRRVFLRSYPLYLEENRASRAGEEEEEEKLAIVVMGSSTTKEKEMVRILTTKGSTGKINNVFKGRVLRVLHWGERKVLHLNKLKHKLSFCLVACHPFGLKHHSPSLF